MAEQLKVQEPQQSKHRFNQEDDSACLNEWNRLLHVFHAIEAARPKDMEKQLDALIKQVTNNKFLTYRQVDGIVGRVASIRDGSFGQSKKGVTLKTT